MAGVLGFEPRDAEIKPGALPLGDTPTTIWLQADKWCGTRDLNPHTSRRQNLNLVRLPISPVPQIWWLQRDSNLRPQHYECCAQPTGLCSHHLLYLIGFAGVLSWFDPILVNHFLQKRIFDLVDYK